MEAKKYRLGEEPFFSMAGESYYAGVPSVWIRTFGCNLQCPGFPCDTEYSWNPDQWDDKLRFTAVEIVDKLLNLLKTKDNPQGLLTHPKTGLTYHFVFTGGEPLLAVYQKLAIEVFDILLSDYAKPQVKDDIIYVTFETNGTQTLNSDFEKALDNDRLSIMFSISPKLHSVSGEMNAINYDNINYLLDYYFVHVKFVCDDTDECERELDEVVDKLENRNGRLWVMPKGTTREDQMGIASIVEKYQAKGYRIATRNHTYIWSDDKGR